MFNGGVVRDSTDLNVTSKQTPSLKWPSCPAYVDSAATNEERMSGRGLERGGSHARRSKFLVVGAARGGVNEATGDALHKQRVWDLEVEDPVDGGAAGGEHLVKLLCLRHVPGEAVEDEACTGS